MDRRAAHFFRPLCWLTTLIFATAWAAARSGARIRGSRDPGVQRP